MTPTATKQNIDGRQFSAEALLEGPGGDQSEQFGLTAGEAANQNDTFEEPVLHGYLKRFARDQYDLYYRSGLYDARYPRPNLATLDAVLSVTPPGASIVDFGCGSGRYAAPVALCCRKVVAYDPSVEAIKLLARRAEAQPNIRATANQDDILKYGPYDLAISLFGVISHIPDRSGRLSALKLLKASLTDKGLLVLSVPNRFRRFYREQAVAALARRDVSGQIFYRRAGIETKLPYFLYTVASLTNDLAEAGFSLVSVRPESLLPEKIVTNSPQLTAVEQRVLPALPASVGYGLLAVARHE